MAALTNSDVILVEELLIHCQKYEEEISDLKKEISELKEREVALNKRSDLAISSSNVMVPVPRPRYVKEVADETEKFVDCEVLTICNQLEAHLGELNGALDGDNALNRTFERLVDHIFEIVQKQSNAAKKGQLRLLHNQIKNKLNRPIADAFQDLSIIHKYNSLDVNQQNNSPTTTIVNKEQESKATDFELVYIDEVERLRKESLDMRHKVDEQTTIINRLISYVHDKEKEENKNVDVVQEPSESEFSPSTSPTECLMNQFNKFFQPKSVSESANKPANANVSSDEEETTLRDEFVRKEAAKINDKFYKCVKCETVIPVEIGFDKYQQHVNECAANKQACPICYKLFEKTQYQQYEIHVTSHLDS